MNLICLGLYIPPPSRKYGELWFLVRLLFVLLKLSDDLKLAKATLPEKQMLSLISKSAFSSFGLYGFTGSRVHFSYMHRHFFLPCEQPHFLLKLFQLLSINRTYSLWQKCWLEGMSGGHPVQPPELALPLYQVSDGFVQPSLINLQGQWFHNLPGYPILFPSKVFFF